MSVGHSETNSSTPLLTSDYYSGIGNANRTPDRMLSSDTDSLVSASARRPYHYPPDRQNVGRLNYGSNTRHDRCHELDASVAYNRYRYYTRLSGTQSGSRLYSGDDDPLAIPDHVIPWYFYIPRVGGIGGVPTAGKQGSLVTIFAIWNMLMGTSLLVLPWALNRAGFLTGVVILVAMTGLCFYTASLIISVPKLANLNVVEFTEACYYLFGRTTHVITLLSSLVTLTGGCVVYWVLMSNFLYHLGAFVFEVVHNNMSVSFNMSGVICADEDADPDFNTNNVTINYLKHYYFNTPDGESYAAYLFAEYWSLKSVPLVLLVFMLPVITLKSVNFFMKFNVIGSVSVMYLLAFAAYKSWNWGVANIDFIDKTSDHYVELFDWEFPTLSGVLSLALFIHNCIISLLSTQKNPANNRRDLGIAYILVGLTYLLISCLIYASFPLSRDCLRDNFIDNFASNDILAFVTRLFLLVQVISLYPLIVYMLRIQVMHLVIPDTTPGYSHIICLNVLLVALCVCFAVYFPRIGTIIRYCGSISGLVFIFTVPPLAHMKAAKMNGNEIGIIRKLLYYVIIAVGVLNCLAQFFVE